MMEVVEEDCGLTDDLKLWCLQLRILIKHWATSCLEILLDPPPPPLLRLQTGDQGSDICAEYFISDLNICLGPNTCHHHHLVPVMLQRMLYSYYVIKTRLVILIFVLAIILSALNIFPTLVLVTCMSYFNLIINHFLCPALNSALCFVFLETFICFILTNSSDVQYSDIP